MEEILTFLRNCGIFYLATCEDGQPHVRPFGAVCAYEGRLYLVTNNQKNVYRQILSNPQVEICGLYQDQWARITGTLALDERREARAAMLEANSSLSEMYAVDDQLMVVLYFTQAEMTVYLPGAQTQTCAF